MAEADIYEIMEERKRREEDKEFAAAFDYAYGTEPEGVPLRSRVAGFGQTAGKGLKKAGSGLVAGAGEAGKVAGKAAERTVDYLSTREGEGRIRGESDEDYRERILAMRRSRGYKPGKTRLQKGAEGFVKGADRISKAAAPNLSKEERMALYFGRVSPAQVGTTVATNPFAQLQAQMASGPNLAGMMHRTDLSALRRAGAPPVVQDVYSEIEANGDVDSVRNVKDDMRRLGHSDRDTSQAIRALRELGLIEREGSQSGSPVYVIVREG